MNTQTIERDFANVPFSALQFKADVEIGDNGPDAKTAPVKMLARSSKPIDHWYWGKVIHDMGGMTLSKPKLPIDYCHLQDEALGYLNKFENTAEGLVTSGALTPFEADDRASEVLYKSKAGVPYEASINFDGDGTVIEEVPTGFTSQVNGTMFEGPGIIIRKWTLRGVAICLYGADQNTTTEFSNKKKPVAVSVMAFNQKENSMPESHTTKTDAEAADETKAVDASTPSQDESKAGEAGGTQPPAVDPTKLSGEAPKVVDPAAKKFIDTFGPDGAMWFVEGKPFEEAATLFVTKLKAEHKTAIEAKDAEIALLKQKVDAASHLGGDPVPSRMNPAEEKPKGNDASKKKLTAALGSESLANFAASLNLPDGPVPQPKKAAAPAT